MEFIDQLWDTAKSYPWMAATLGLWLALWKFFGAPLAKDDTTRTRIGLFLVGSSFPSRYRAILRKTLKWLDRKLSTHEMKETPNLRPRAWSFGLLNLSIALALAYPIFGLMLTWMFFNDGAIAGLLIIPPKITKLHVT